MAKDYSGPHTLRALIRIIVNALGGKLDRTDVVNDLDTATTNAPLSAAQGRLLKQKLDSLDTDGDGVVDNAQMFAGHTPDYFAKATDVASKLDEQIGEPNGLAPLDATGKISSEYLPSYVDDVIEGHFDETAGVFYTDAEKTQAVTGEAGKIYVDLDSNVSYRFGGTVYVPIASGDIVELTADDVQAMWDAAMGGTTEEPGTEDNA